MALGLGQMLGMGLLSQFMGGFGNNEKKKQLGGGGQQGVMDAAKLQALKQQGQVANNQQGFMGGLSGISNSMFRGMSPEQVARLGMGFNAMTLNPNAGLQTAFQSTIDNARKKTNRNATVEALIKMGKPNLANLVQTGAMPVATAMQLAFKETTGDSKGTIAWMETFRGKGTPEQDSKIDSYRALVEASEGDAVAVRNAVTMFSNDFNVGVKDLKDTTSGIQIQQKDGMVMGKELKEGQKYTIVTDEFGEQTLNVIEGAFGESEAQQYTRELEQQLDTADQKLAVDRSNEAYLSAMSAIDSVQKYQHVQSILKNPDGTFNEDAISGWITNRLPSFTADQAIIKATANLMGIDVINMATFGALSEREMQMAMQTNLDTNLPPEELYKQIVGMVEARQKLAQAMLTRAQRISELGSWEKYKAEQIVERKGHLATRYKVMPSEVQQAIMVGKYKSDTRNHPDITFETWDANNEMTGYEIWSYFNFNDRARFIANMEGMTGKKFLEIMGHTDFASQWWMNNEGNM
jgi:hypothetical protein